MQENKIDTSQIIGFALMILLLVGYFFWTKPTEEQLEAERQKQELAEAQKAEDAKETAKEQEKTAAPLATDSLGNSISAKTFTLENDNVIVKLTNDGAQISEVELKNYKAYDKESGFDENPLYLFHDKSANFALKFNDAQGRLLDLSKRTFSAQQQGQSVVFTTQENGGTIQYIYTLNDSYDLSLEVKSTGFGKISNQKEIQTDFLMNAISQEKGKQWEQRMTDIHYSLNNYSDVDYTRNDFTASADETVDWVAFKQQFFTTVLEKENGLKNVKLNVTQKENDSLYSKEFLYQDSFSVNGELNEKYQWHFFPLEYDMLKGYGKDLETIIPFGWGIFGWINKFIILPVFKFMSSWGLAYGWVIALLTIFVKLVTSPIMYKQYKQSAMMRVLKPDIEVINEKFPGKDNAMKRQQETMNMYRTAGFNPLAGCFPMLLQMPIFYALFSFFPNIINLRGKSFLWADDLTAYDSIYHLPFNIPFYGDHVSLFAVLYVITMVVYFKISGNTMQTPQQEGMPDMSKLMYVMPVMFLFFLNSYASGLSWYYFVSNAINIGLVFFIKNVMIDEKKIHAKIQEKKKNPKKKKKSKWQERLDQAMKQAQEQQKNKK